MNQFGRIIMVVWIPVAIAIMIPLLLLNIATSVLLNTIREDSTQRLKTSMAATNRDLETIVKDADTTIQLIIQDEAIRTLALMSKEKNFADYSQIANTKQVQNQMNFFNSFGYITSFYFENSDVFISGKGICDNASEFYTSLYSFEGLSLDNLCSYASHFSSIRQYLPYGKYRIGGAEYEGIAYITNVGGLYNTLAITVIPKQTLESILSQTTQTNGASAIVDVEGEILYIFGETPQFFNDSLNNITAFPEFIEDTKDQATLITSFSDEAGVYLVSWNPQAEVYQDFLRLNQVIWMLNISCIISAMVISFIVVRSQVLQLQRTLQLLSPNLVKIRRGIFGQIDQIVSSLISDKFNLNEHIKQKDRTITEYFWINFLNGYWKESKQIHNILQDSTNLMNCAGYSIVSVFFRFPIDEISGIEDMSVLSQHCEALYQNICRDPNFIGKISRPSISQITIIYGYDQKSLMTYREKICEVLSPYHSFLNNKETIVVVSKPFHDIMEAPEYYMECWNYGINTHNFSQCFIWEEDIQFNKNKLLYFPSELENRIISSITEGNFTLVKECLHSFIQRNFSDDVLPTALRDYMRSKFKIIFSTVYQEKMRFSLEEIFDKINQIDRDTVFISYILNTSHEMCDYYLQLAASEKDFKQKVLEYIETEFANPELSLSMISEHFSFSESHFSKMLKNILSENFSTYLERKRMEVADQLIISTDLKVEEIALRVSYYNVGSFRRAYKRYIGVSPTERRSQHHKS